MSIVQVLSECTWTEESGAAPSPEIAALMNATSPSPPPSSDDDAMLSPLEDD